MTGTEVVAVALYAGVVLSVELRLRRLERSLAVDDRLRSELDRLEVDLHDLRDHVARELAKVPASPYRGAP